MRVSLLSIALVLIAATRCAAQEGRFAFELTAGRATDSPIFRHDVTDPAVGATTSTRLTVDDESVVAGRIGYRVAGHWMLVGEVGHGPSGFHYSTVSIGAGGLYSSEEQWGTASRTTLDLALAYHTMLDAIPLSVEPELGVGLRRLTVGTPGVVCVQPPPSLGTVPPPCFASERWERTYSVPSVSLGLALGYTVAPRISAELRGAYAVGRTSTREGFYVDLIPQYDYAEAPTSQTIRSSTLSLGLRVTP